MNDDMKVIIQWPNGSMLPVLTKRSSKMSDLSKLLRFACLSNEEIKLLINGILLDPNKTLENQFVKDNDILKAIITPKVSTNKQQLNSKIQSIILEAAKISDKQYNLLVKNKYIYKTRKETSSDEDYHEFIDFNINEKVTEIPSEPLPAFWENSNPKLPDLLNIDILEDNSIEETGKFLEKKGWSSWIW